MNASPLIRLLTLPSRLYYGWRIVALGGIINAIAGGIYQYGFGIFFLPISRDLDLTRAQTSLVFSLSRAEGAIEGPFAGYLVDRFGPKYVIAGGAFLTGFGYMALSYVDSYTSFLLTYLFFISLSFNLGFGHSVLAAVNNWFVRRRGFAMSMTTAAFSVGGAVVSPILAILVAAYGWRQAAFLAGFAFIFLVVPAAFFMKRSPESMGLLPDGDTEPPSPEKLQHISAFDFTVREGLRTKVFWVLAVATTLRLAVVNTVSIQFVPFMVWKGVDEVTGAFLLSTMATMAICSRIFVGWMGDKFPKKYMLAMGLFTGSAAFTYLQFAQPGWQLWLFVVMYAMVEGVNSLNWAIIGDYYGRASFATLRGIMAFVYTWGTAAAPWLAGYTYDTTQSYSIVLWGMTISYLIGGMIFLSLRPPAPPVRAMVEATGSHRS